MTAMPSSFFKCISLFYLWLASLWIGRRAISNIMLYFLACPQWHRKTQPFFKSPMLPRGQKDVVPVLGWLDTIFNNHVADTGSRLLFSQKQYFPDFMRKQYPRNWKMRDQHSNISHVMHFNWVLRQIAKGSTHQTCLISQLVVLYCTNCSEGDER